MDTNARKLIRGTLCVIRDLQGRYLMRHQIGGINNGCWIFPGGDYDIVEQEDRTELGPECAKRETREETGITPNNPRLIARIFFDNRYRIFPGKTQVANFDYDADYYFADRFSGELAPIGPEGTRQDWFNYEDARKLQMHQGDLAVLEKLEQTISVSSNIVIGGVIVHEGSNLKSATFRQI